MIIGIALRGKVVGVESGSVEIGQSWAYRARGIDPAVEVQIVRVGTHRPARVLVRFVDDDFEGKEDWVPPSRLKVLWEQVDAFRARETRWDEILKLGLPRDDPRESATEHMFLEYIANEHAYFGCSNSGCEVHLVDPAALAESLSLDIRQLTGHPATFVEDDILIAPWPVTETIVVAAARKYAEEVLTYVEAEERQAKHEAIHGSHLRTSGKGNGYYFDAVASREMDLEFGKPIREVLRQWCGAELTERFDELTELRKEIRRVGEIAQRAVDLLERSGSRGEAERLRRELGATVEMLRADE
ncbi:MAG: hypothetical protein JWR83_3662 [Aeromicrobium sp.]|nr:hypothetical protein [Aeromicrobium sp.]